MISRFVLVKFVDSLFFVFELFFFAFISKRILWETTSLLGAIPSHVKLVREAAFQTCVFDYLFLSLNFCVSIARLKSSQEPTYQFLSVCCHSTLFLTFPAKCLTYRSNVSSSCSEVHSSEGTFVLNCCSGCIYPEFIRV